MLKIRLRRGGKKHQPHYRIVVAEHTSAVKGKYIALLGHYDPKTKQIVVDKKEAVKWMDNGAKPSNTVAKLLKQEGIKHKLIVIHKYKPTKSKKEQANEKSEQPAEAKPAEKPAKTEEAKKPEESNSEDGRSEDKKEDSKDEDKK